MPTTWVLSSHGAVTKTATASGAKGIQLLQIPKGITMHFFVPDNTIFYEGWPAYNALMSNPVDWNAAYAVKGYHKYEKPAIPSYYMQGDASWIDSNGLSASGIFVAGDTYHANAATMYLEQDVTYTLKDFFESGYPKVGDHVFWLCCRVWV